MTVVAGGYSRPRGHVTTDGTFRCDGCGRRRTSRVRHASGFCVDCIAAGGRFWLRRFTLAELVALAALVWPADFQTRRDAA